jgi:hypothetical protein
MVNNYSTTFPSIENPINEVGSWINGGLVGLDWTDMRVSTSGKAIGTETGQAASIYDDSCAVLAGPWANNQQVQCTIFQTRPAGNWNSELEGRLRSSITAHSNTGYEFNFRIKTGDTPYGEIIRWNGAIGSFTPLIHTDNANWILLTGDSFRATAVGSVLTSYLTIAGFNGGNGVGKEFQACTYDTSTGNDGGTGGNPGGPDSVIWTTGKPGLGSFAHDFGATPYITLYGFISFSAVDL